MSYELLSDGAASEELARLTDWVTRPESEPMQVLLKENWIDAVAPKSRIDYILLRKHDPWRIVETIIVDEKQTEYLVSTSDNTLTLITCYPFDAIRPGGPLRYLVIAKQHAPVITF